MSRISHCAFKRASNVLCGINPTSLSRNATTEYGRGSSFNRAPSPNQEPAGTPAKVVRPLRQDEIDGIRIWADHYVDLGPLHKAHEHKDAPMKPAY